MRYFRILLTALLLTGLTVPVTALAATAAPQSPHSQVTVHPGVHLFGHTALIRAYHGPRLPSTHLPAGRRAIVKVRNQTRIATRNWSGYADQACGTCKFRYVQASLTVPALNCRGVTTDGQYWASSWDGLDGFTSSTVEQTGLFAFCDHSIPVYVPFWEMYPAPAQAIGTITGFGAGDAATVSVYFNYASSFYTLTFTDVTQGVGFTATEPCGPGPACQNTSAEVIEEAPFVTPPGDFAPLADFGQAFFTSDTVTTRNGTHGNLDASVPPYYTPYAINMVDGADLLASPGALVNGTGAGLLPISDFTDTWKASA